MEVNTPSKKVPVFDFSEIELGVLVTRMTNRTILELRREDPHLDFSLSSDLFLFSVRDLAKEIGATIKQFDQVAEWIMDDNAKSVVVTYRGQTLCVSARDLTRRLNKANKH